MTFFNFLASHDGIGLNPARGILEPREIDALVQTALNHDGFVSYKNNPDGTKSPYELNISYFDALSNPSAAESEDTRCSFSRSALDHARYAGSSRHLLSFLYGSRGDRRAAEESGIPRRINRKLDLA